MANLNQRKLKGTLVRPRRQLALAVSLVAFGFIGLVVVSVIGSYLIKHTIVGLADQYDIDPASAQRAAATLLMGFSLVAGLGFATLTAVFVGAFVVSHRIYGPMVAVNRHLKQLTAGEYEARLKLREHDEFQDLARTLNRLGETLHAKLRSQV